MDLWELKTGQRSPDDLDDNFQVQLGIYTEDFNRWWFTRTTDIAVVEAEHRVSREHPFMAAHVDGEALIPTGGSAVFEAKHVGGFKPLREVVAQYQPQLHHNMIVTGWRKAYLSLIIGNSFDYQEIEFDEDYAKALIAAERDFWECVTLKLPPGDIAPKVRPPEATKVIDMTGNNAWADAAYIYTTTAIAADKFEKATKAIKAMVPPDAKTCMGHGIQVERSKANALRIKAL
jgi:predicted phage-related endonuclease